MRLKIMLLAILVSAVMAIYFQLIEHAYFGVLKAITTLIIIQIPLSFSTLFNDSTDQHFRKILIVGFVFCLVGDILLLEEARFIYGLLAFLVAHLLFCYGFYYQNKNKLSFVSLVLFALIGASYFIFLLPNLGDIAIPVAIYILVIVCMSWLATELYLGNKTPAHLAVFLGAILFLISDATLAFNKFVGEFDYSGIAILGTYWLAITLFAYSTVVTQTTVNK